MRVGEAGSPRVVVGKGAVDLVVHVADVELKIGCGIGEPPVDRQVSRDAQVVAGGERAEIARVGNLRHDHLGDPLGHLALLGRARVEEDAGRHLHRGDAEAGILAADVDEGRTVDVDPGDPGPLVGGWVIRKESVVEVGQEHLSLDYLIERAIGGRECLFQVADDVACRGAANN